MKRWPLHFIPFLLYLIYFIPFYTAPAQYKYDSYYFVHHLTEFRSRPEYHFFHVWSSFRNFQMQIFYLQTTIYLIFTFQKLNQMWKSESGLTPVIRYFIRWWFIFSMLFAILLLLVMTVKIIFIKDLGDHIIAIVLTFILYMSTIAEMIRPSQARVVKEMNSPGDSRKGSSIAGLDEGRMSGIFMKLTNLMETEHLYRDNLISLQKLARLTGEPAYVVSKVINEKSGYTFFDWIAYLRVEEARKLLLDPKTGNYTIEQIAEEVGYNSKSAFNKAFKKFTGKTPSEYRTS
jgi:AraC-like DNA-binding protein